MATFPKYLIIQMRRYYWDDKWLPQKLEVGVNVPEKLDLSCLKAQGLQKNEVELPSDKAAAAGFQASEGILSTIQGMGFSKNAAIRAAKATNNQAEQALNWVLEHSTDADVNDPLPAEGGIMAESQHLHKMLLICLQ
eukprot:UN24075